MMDADLGRTGPRQITHTHTHTLLRPHWIIIWPRSIRLDADPLGLNAQSIDCSRQTRPAAGRYRRPEL